MVIIDCMETKQCIKCQSVKPLVSFYKNRNGKLNSCKECIGNYQRKNGGKYQKECKKKYGLGAGTIVRYGLKTALEVYDRAKRKCQKCEEENDLTIHHLDNNGRNNEEKGLPVNNNSKNLIVLCRRCHGSIHGKETMKTKRSYKEKECLECKKKFIPVINFQKFCKLCRKEKKCR